MNQIIKNNQINKINQVKLAHHRTEFRSCFLREVFPNNAADDDNRDSPNLIALVSCKFPWNLVIEAMKISMLNADISVAGLKSGKY